MDDMNHGSYSTYTNKKCRCDDCTTAAREYQRSKKGEPKKRGRRPKPLVHGTQSGYQKGCRCDECSQALREYRKSRGGMPLDDPRHGTVNGYTNLRCRCDECKAAVAENRKSYAALEDDDPRHGSLNAYYNFRCRCDICRKAVSDYQRVSGNARRGNLKANYGITPEQWDELFENQNGQCASCGDVPPEDAKRRFHVDHDHTTGEVRGILCHSCNVALGHLKEDQERIAALGRYLALWKPF